MCSSHTSESSCGRSKRVVVFGAIQATPGGCRSHLSELNCKVLFVTNNTDSNLVAFIVEQFNSQADMPGSQHGFQNSATQARPHEYVP